MSLSLPPSSSPIRQLFEVSDLAKLASVEERAKLPTHPQAVLAARRVFESETAAKAVHILVHRSTGELWLERFGPRGGWTRVWNFGSL